MAIRHFEGFELISDAADFAARYGGTSAIGGSSSFDPGRLHGTCLDVGSTTGTIIDITFDDQQDWYVGLQLGNDGSTQARLGSTTFKLMSFLDGGVEQFYIQLRKDPNNTNDDNEYRLEAYRGNGVQVGVTDVYDNQVGSPSAGGEFNRIEARVFVDPDAGVVEIRVNGATALFIEGLNTTSDDAATSADQVILNVRKFGGTDVVLIDDIYWSNTRFLGDVTEYGVRPGSDGDASEWAPLSGTDHYAMVDERPSDEDVSYLSSSAADQVELFNFLDSDLFFSGTIAAVTFMVGARLETAGSHSLDAVLKSGSLEYDYDQVLPVTSTSYATPSYVIETHPATGVALRLSDLREEQWGFGSNAASPVVRVSQFQVGVLLFANAADRTLVPLSLASPSRNVLIPDWNQGMRLNSAWRTDIAKAIDGSEERTGLVNRPYRTLSVSFTGLGKRFAVQHLMNLLRQGTERLQFPLACDHSRVTAATSGTTIWCDARYRRFHPGGRVLIHGWSLLDGAPVPTNPEYATILAVGEDRIFLESALSGSFAAGDRVFPVMDTEINLEGDLTQLTDAATDMTMVVREVIGQSALPSSFLLPPADLTVNAADQRYVLDLGVNWAEPVRVRSFRDGKEQASGRGLIQDALGTRPRFIHEFDLLSTSREQAWRVIQFFDAVRGRNRAWWMVNPGTVFEVTALTTTKATVTPFGNIQDAQAFIENVAIIGRDGSHQIRGVASIAVAGSEWDVTFDSSITVPTSLRRMTTAHLARMVGDEIEEQWETNEVCRVRFEGIELLNEADIDIPNVTIDESTLDGYSELTAIPDLYLLLDAGVNTYAATASNANTRETSRPEILEEVGVWDDVRRTPSFPYARGNTVQGSRLRAWQWTDPTLGGSRVGLLHEGTIAAGLDGMVLQNGNEDFFDNTDGLTIFYVWQSRFTTVGGQEDGYILMRINGVLDFHYRGIELYETLDVAPGATEKVEIPVSTEWLTSGRGEIDCFRWDPGVALELYANGHLKGAASAPITDMPEGSLRTCVIGNILDGFAAGPFVNTQATHPVTYAIAIFSRYLTDAEMNIVGGFYGSRFNMPWETI